MRFLKDYGIFKAVTGETESDKMMGIVLASMSDNDKKNSNKKNIQNSKYKDRRKIEISEDD